MANIQRNNACENFTKEYCLLTDTKKNTFSRLCNKLLNDNFIYATKNDDRNDYYDTLSMHDLIENYFSMMDYDLVHIDTYKIFYLKTNADRNRLKLKKFETVLILVLRLLYHKGSLDVNSSSDISTTYVKLVTEVNQTGIFKGGVPKTEYKNALALLKRYKIIDYNFLDLEKEDSVILIYPTILFVVTIDDIDMLNQKIKTYINNKGDDLDEVNED